MQSEGQDHRKRYFSTMLYDEYVEQFDHPPNPPLIKYYLNLSQTQTQKPNRNHT